jgi:glycosyltransferase involved in cell wall biosynthesis
MISVCIPTRNYGRFLRDAIESVLGQTRRDFELIVVDNCSTDDTPRILEEYARKHPELRCTRNDAPLSMAGNFNRALGLARGELVKVLCADDWLAPQALEKSAAALAAYPQAAIAATARTLVSEAREPLGIESYGREAGVVDGKRAIERCLYGTNYVGEPSAVLFRRSLAGPGFDESFTHLLDLELWFRLLEQGALAFVPEPLAMIRRHEAQATRGNVRAGEIVADKKRLYAAYVGRPYVRRTWAKDFLWRLRLTVNVLRAMLQRWRRRS